MVAIISGLNSFCIQRLKRTWGKVNTKFMTSLSSCECLLHKNRNFANYHLTITSVVPPAIPYIGALTMYSGQIGLV